MLAIKRVTLCSFLPSVTLWAGLRVPAVTRPTPRHMTPRRCGRNKQLQPLFTGKLHSPNMYMSTYTFKNVTGAQREADRAATPNVPKANLLESHSERPATRYVP